MKNEHATGVSHWLHEWFYETINYWVKNQRKRYIKQKEMWGHSNPPLHRKNIDHDFFQGKDFQTQ